MSSKCKQAETNPNPMKASLTKRISILILFEFLSTGISIEKSVSCSFIHCCFALSNFKSLLDKTREEHYAMRGDSENTKKVMNEIRKKTRNVSAVVVSSRMTTQTGVKEKKSL